MPHVTWVSAHGALTHFPIAMLIGMLAFDIGAALFRKPEWRVVSFWMLVVAVVGCLPSLLTGLQTGTKLFGDSLPQVAALHRNLAYATSGMAFVILLLRMRGGDKARGALAAVILLLSFATVGIVSWAGYLGGAMTLGEVASPSAAPTHAAAAASAATAALDPALISKGKALYASSNCAGCHKINGSGGAGGPDLSHEGTGQPDIAWQVAHLQNPQKMNPNSDMPAFAKLGNDNLKAIATYVVSNK